tara:strand:+ start:22670 stop:23503 length:834 start_codon:yes stop_codon:yes gene_type:complete
MITSNKKAQELLKSFQKTSNNPYTFSNHRIIADKAKAPELSKKERDIVREQHMTLFEYDEAMQKLFKGDFEAYFSAIENPDLMIKQMDERMHEIEQDLTGTKGSIISDENDDEFLSDSDVGGGILDRDFDGIESKDLELSFEKDELYKKSVKWSDNLHNLGHTIYDEKRIKDIDIFRVTINSFLVPAKIAYAVDLDEDIFDIEDEEIIKMEIETSIKAYGLALTFLQRIRESLTLLVNKKIDPIIEWRTSITDADEIVLEIQKRVLGLKQKLDPKSK